MLTHCPNCGTELPSRARVCPECGSDEETGWSDEAAASGLDLPDAEFDYDEYVRKEFGGQKPVPRGIHWFWWVVGLIVLAIFIAEFVLPLF